MRPCLTNMRVWKTCKFSLVTSRWLWGNSCSCLRRTLDEKNLIQTIACQLSLTFMQLFFAFDQGMRIEKTLIQILACQLSSTLMLVRKQGVLQDCSSFEPCLVFIKAEVNTLQFRYKLHGKSPQNRVTIKFQMFFYNGSIMLKLNHHLKCGEYNNDPCVQQFI